jgi:NADPH:quinone reductase-like Zn-dependent oxidoreductase
MTDRSAQTVRIERFGGPEVIGVKSLPVPDPAPDEILVRVAIASINPVDWKTAEGKYPPIGQDKLPFSLGRDLSGIIEAVGDESGRRRIGDRICAFVGNGPGAQGELVIVKTDAVVAVPDGIDLTDAGAVPLAAMTAWQGLFDHGGLEAGQRVLIHGGAGGVGHMAVQFARWKGATVFATASDKDLDFVRSLGAQTAIDYKNERFEDVVADLDLVFDTQGGETQARSFAVLRKGGTLVSTLEPDEQKAAEMEVRTVPRWHADPDADALGKVLALMAEGAVRVTITRSFPLEQVREAQHFAQTAHPRGKVVLSNTEG